MDARRLAALRPDTPEWVDLRGFLLSGDCDVVTNADPAAGWLACPRFFPVAAAAGEPDSSLVRQTAERLRRQAGTEWHLLAPRESLASVTAALAGWKRREVLLHGWPEGAGFEPPAPPDGYEIRLAAGGWQVAGWEAGLLPVGLQVEYTSSWVRRQPMAAAWHAGRPVAFCFSAVATESLWDVAVDTVPEHRRRGLAAACFHQLADHLDGRGLKPVWGALAANQASVALARRLGFRLAARLTSFFR